MLKNNDLYDLQVAFIPFNRFINTLLEAPAWIVAEQLFGLGNISIAVLYISWSVGTKVWFNIDAERLCQAVINIYQVFASAESDVESLTCGFMRSETGFEICLYHVFNIGEISALSPITVYRRNFAIQQLFDEFRDNSCISTVRVLPASENVEISHTVGVKPVMHCILLSPFLIGAFCHSVGR